MKTIFSLALLASASVVYGDPINVFNTGVNNAGVKLANNTADSHYTLIAAPAVGLTARAARVPTLLPLAWLADGASTASSWIRPTPTTPLNSNQVGNYTYQQTFTLNFTPGTAILAGRWSTDNGAQMFLNGNLIATTGALAFTAWQNFSTTNASFFTAGVNTLTFVVNNANSGPIGNFLNPTGLRVEFTAASVPEPVEILSLALMAAGLFFVARRFKALPTV